MDLRTLATVIWRVIGGVFLIYGILTAIVQLGAVSSTFGQIMDDESPYTATVLMGIFLWPAVSGIAGIVVIVGSHHLARFVVGGLESRDSSESTKILRAIVDNSRNGLLRFRNPSVVEQEPVVCIYSNKAANRLLGATSSKLQNSTIHDVMLLITNGMSPSAAEDVHRQVDKGLQSDGTFELMMTDHPKRAGSEWRLFLEPLGDDVILTIVEIPRGTAN